MEIRPDLLELLDELSETLGTDREGALEIALSVTGTIAAMTEAMLRRKVGIGIPEERR